ncbi:MAG TPA: hypothetical protein VFL72_07690 [Acidimicrobiia bacterium]|nr:hypothetical protein [Acidimicrobiia bacterium]
MNPYLYSMLVQDRLDRATDAADARRLAKQASPGPATGGLRSLRAVVGQGLIAIGEKLVDHPDAEEHDLNRAA